MGGGKVQGEAVVVKAGGGGEREWRQWWEGLRGQVGIVIFLVLETTHDHPRAGKHDCNPESRAVHE